MTVKKLILIGSISLVVVAAAIVVPITVTRSMNQNNGTRQPTQDDVIDDDKLGPEMQTKLDSAYDTYHTAALSDSKIASKEKDFVYVSETKGLTYSTEADKLYYWSMNTGVWELYSSSKISLTPVVEPEQLFSGYYVYYNANI